MEFGPGLMGFGPGLVGFGPDLVEFQLKLKDLVEILGLWFRIWDFGGS